MFEIPKLGDEDNCYDGSRAFTWLADICGLSVDLVSIYHTISYSKFHLVRQPVRRAHTHAHTEMRVAVDVWMLLPSSEACEIHI